jgi:hypothetical protein
MHPHQVLNLAAVRLLQWPEAADIEWLKKMGEVRRHAECDDVVLLAMELEFGRVVAFVAVEDLTTYICPSSEAPYSSRSALIQSRPTALVVQPLSVVAMR